jgi:magnesium chelatase family protein
MAVGVLNAGDQIIDGEQFKKSIFIGELSLNGELRHVNGILPITMFAAEKGYERIFLPEVYAQESSLIKGVDIIQVKSLLDLVAHLLDEIAIKAHKKQRSGEAEKQSKTNSDFDFSYVSGQEQAKRPDTRSGAAGASRRDQEPERVERGGHQPLCGAAGHRPDLKQEGSAPANRSGADVAPLT